jgi:hypothetical protein
LAVLRFTISSNFIGCSTARSAGLARLRIKLPGRSPELNDDVLAFHVPAFAEFLPEEVDGGRSRVSSVPWALRWPEGEKADPRLLRLCGERRDEKQQDERS